MIMMMVRIFKQKMRNYYPDYSIMIRTWRIHEQTRYSYSNKNIIRPYEVSLEFWRLGSIQVRAENIWTVFIRFNFVFASSFTHWSNMHV